MAYNKNGIWRPNQEWRKNIAPGQRAQFTSNSHALNSYRLAIQLAKSGTTVPHGIFLNRAVSTAIQECMPHINLPEGKKAAGLNFRPDVTAVMKDGSIQAFEILSKTDTATKIATRNETSIAACKNLKITMDVKSYEFKERACLPERAVASDSVGTIAWNRNGVVDKVLKFAVVAGAATSLYRICSSTDKYHAVALEAGSWSGALAGAAIGTMIGGPIGGVVGGVVGAIGGEKMADKLYGGVDLSMTLTFADNVQNVNMLMLDPVTGKIAFAGKDQCTEPLFGGASLEDFAVALKCVYFGQEDPAFSLDGEDRLNPFGPFQKKVFYPDFLAGTRFGEALFAADYLLKELSLGLETNDDGTQKVRESSSVLPNWKNEFELGENTSKNPMHRMWIVVRKVEVRKQISEGIECFALGNIELAVRACALELDPNTKTGVRDHPCTDPEDVAKRFAEQATWRMPELIGRFSEFRRLLECIKAVAVAHILKSTIIPVERDWSEILAGPEFITDVRVPTLTRTIENRSKCGNTVTTSTRTIVGGCCLNVGDVISFKTCKNSSTISANILELFKSGKFLIPPQCYAPGVQLSDESTKIYYPKEGVFTIESGVHSSPIDPFCLSLPFSVNLKPNPHFAKGDAGMCSSCARSVPAEEAAVASVDGHFLCSYLECMQTAVMQGSTSRKSVWKSVTFLKLPKCAVCNETVHSIEAYVKYTHSKRPLVAVHKHCHVCSIASCTTSRDNIQYDFESCETRCVNHYQGQIYAAEDHESDTNFDAIPIRNEANWFTGKGWVLSSSTEAMVPDQRELRKKREAFLSRFDTSNKATIKTESKSRTGSAKQTSASATDHQSPEDLDEAEQLALAIALSMSLE